MWPSKVAGSKKGFCMHIKKKVQKKKRMRGMHRWRGSGHSRAWPKPPFERRKASHKADMFTHCISLSCYNVDIEF